MAENTQKDNEVYNICDDLLKILTEHAAVAYSGKVSGIVRGELEKNGIEASIQKDGSVYGFLPGAGDKSIMLACHIDEIGFVVSQIEKSGFIRFSQIGGCDVRILPGQQVVVMGKEDVRGYISIKPPHLLTPDERNKVLPLGSLFIDTGLPMKKLKTLVKIGDAIAFDGKYRRLHGDFRSAKSLDNRASVACGMMVMLELARTGSAYNLHFVATSQEEYTGLGARIHSFRLPIDYAIVVDVTHGESADLRDDEAFLLNKGPAIGRGATIPQTLYRLLVKSATELAIPYQVEAMPASTGTDADAIAFNREGIPTCVVSIPLRYMHTPVEVVSLKDIVNTAKLIVQFIRYLV